MPAQGIYLKGNIHVQPKANSPLDPALYISDRLRRERGGTDRRSGVHRGR